MFENLPKTSLLYITYRSPLTRMRNVLPSCFIVSMKGAKVISNLGEIFSTGGMSRVTFFLIGGFKTIDHLETSGSWSFRTRIVFLVAVAVIINILPFRLLSSPVDNAMAGRKADLDVVFSPQLTTVNQ